MGELGKATIEFDVDGLARLEALIERAEAAVLKFVEAVDELVVLNDAKDEE